MGSGLAPPSRARPRSVSARSFVLGCSAFLGRSRWAAALRRPILPFPPASGRPCCPAALFLPRPPTPRHALASLLPLCGLPRPPVRAALPLLRSEACGRSLGGLGLFAVPCGRASRRLAGGSVVSRSRLSLRPRSRLRGSASLRLGRGSRLSSPSWPDPAVSLLWPPCFAPPHLPFLGEWNLVPFGGLKILL